MDSWSGKVDNFSNAPVYRVAAGSPTQANYHHLQGRNYHHGLLAVALGGEGVFRQEVPT